MRNSLRCLLVLGSLWSVQALAVNVDGYDYPYFAAQYAFESPDDVRDSDDGNGYQLTLGIPLKWKRTAAELSLYDVGRERNLDGKKDYQTSLFVDLVRDLGTFGWEGSSFKFKPFGLAGIGAVQDDVLGDKHLHFGGNLGIGALFPTSWHGLAVRTEARWQIHENKKSVAGEDILQDYRLMLGLQIPLAFLAEGKPAAAPAADCPVGVVSVEGRSDCPMDSDGDGVTDASDDCPGTAAGTLVDAKGCAMTSDGFVLRGVNFELDSAQLTESSKGVLDNVAATLIAQNITVLIGGHTDDSGSAAYNMMLSQQRAESVRQYLISKGVDSNRLRAQGFGMSQPLVANDTDSARAENRRVEFKIIVE